MIRTDHPRRRQIVPLVVTVVAGVAIALAGCAPSSQPGQTTKTTLGLPDKEYSLDALIEAAKKEGPITVYDVTGKIVDTAKAFTATYGIQATGVKAKANEQQEIMTREAQAGSVNGDVYFMTDAPAVSGDLLTRGIATNWFPPDLKKDVPERYQLPTAVSNEVDAWTYNTEAYGDKCPVDNIWALTTEDWRDRVALSDPLLRADFLYWVNQMQEHADDDVAAAYQDYFGRQIDNSKGTATAQWLQGIAQNSPIVMQSGGDVAEAIGASGQTDPPMGMVSTAEYRENADSGFHLGLCTGIAPWLGRSYAKVGVIASGTNNPNAAKLFVHYLLTKEGIEPQLADGKISTNTTIPAAPDEPSGIVDQLGTVFNPDPATAADDLDSLADWQDFWTVNSR